MLTRILVTGGAGFIGSNFVRHLLSGRGLHVVNLDALTYAGNRDNLAEFISHPNHRFVHGDINDRALVSALLNEHRIEAIVNFAAESHVDRSIAGPEVFVRTNVSGTLNLLEAARMAKVSRFLQISCYDEQTRALTKEGLKHFSELQVGDQVLSLNLETGKVEEKRIEKIIVQDYAGEMIHFKNARVDLKVTPNHRMLFRQKGRKGLGPIRVAEAREILSKHFLFYPRGRWDEANYRTVDIEGLGALPTEELFYVTGVFIGDGFVATQTKQVPSITGLNKPESDELRRDPQTGRFEKCMAKIGTHTHSTCTGWRIFFDVPESDKARKPLEQALTKLGIKWKAHRGKSGEHLYFSSKQWTLFFEQFGKGFQNKHIPPWMLSYGHSALTALFAGLIDSDGHFNQSGRPIFSSSSRRLVENICEVGIKLGFSPRISKREAASAPILGKEKRVIRASTDAYIVHFRTENVGIGQRACTKEFYKGKIWCVKVKDNKNLVVERNGILQFCGNTDEVYGSLPATGLFTEESPLQPNNPYSASKASADLLALAYHRTFNFPVIIARPSNNFGPYQFPEKLLPLMIVNALTNQPLPIYGDGQNVRDWLYVEDNCRALELILREGRVGEIYNISGGSEWKNIALVEKLADLLDQHLGLAGDRSVRRLITFVADRPGHDRRYASDSSKLERELGWKRAVSFEEGLRRTVAWYVTHERWWRRIQSGEYRS